MNIRGFNSGIDAVLFVGLGVGMLAFLALGAAIILIPMLFNMLVGHLVLRLPFDDLLGAAAGGVGGNPAILAFGSKLVPTDRADITYATTFPAATITKIVLVQVMLAMMRNS